ncbi:MATE family efflux transporter [Thalassomonas sp. M1454]|uniref:MATE family efflux transporter n=1 Tax=Thalassomonas sp. M1454 TaxID=2594477 RepID=UPI001180B2B0|nr:MATE family efflux transporter [Thalassomonas sp. M1454]TRX55192.1 MATE family efflux transporter [Thalassomonas sp. M1454]
MPLLNTKALKSSIKLAWPISLQNTLITLLSMIDVMMVSHLGNASVAAVGLGNRVQFVILVIVTGLSWGVGILSAQYYGSGNTQKIRRSILMGAILSFFALLPIVLLSFYFADDVISLGSNDADVIAIGESYLWITMPSLIFVGATMVIENALRSINQVKLPMFLSMMAIMLNIILNYWLINGGLGVPALNVDGAAIATLVSRIMHLILLFAVLTAIKHKIKPTRHDVKSLLEFQPWKKLVILVIPLMFSFGVWSVGTFVYQLIYGRLGTQELAVISLLVPIEGVFTSLFFGFASACSIMVGHRLGANKFDEAWDIGKTFAILAPTVALGLGGVLLLLEPIIFMPFNDMPTDTLTMASEVFLIIALCAWIKITNMTLAMGILRAGGETKACLYIDILGMWMVSIPLTMLAAFYFELPMFWVVLTAYSEEACKFFLFGWRVAQKKWLRNLT